MDDNMAVTAAMLLGANFFFGAATEYWYPLWRGPADNDLCHLARPTKGAAARAYLIHMGAAEE